MALIDDTALLRQIGQVLQTEPGSFPAVLQRVLLLLEESWPPVRASLSLVGGPSLVTGQSDLTPGGSLVSVPLGAGDRNLGVLSLEYPDGPRRQPEVPQNVLAVTAILIAQEAEVRRRVGAVQTLPPALAGPSGVMAEVWRRVGLVAGTTETVLLVGEPGTGQDLLAAEIHRRSAVAGGPFVRFNGAALPESMVESELFGHAKGVGGRFEEAHGGTLFLDEVGDLSLGVQARLLQVLEEGTVGRAGSSRSVPVNLRLVASTSRNLDTRIASGRFRADLAARLSVFPIQIPPLRDRGADIIAIADRLVTDFSLQIGKTIMRISTPALEMLLTYPWPGNVRELEDVLERAVLLSDDEVIHGYHLPPSLQSSVHSGTRMHGRLEDRLDSLEYEMLVEALKASRGNVTQAARELGLTKRIMGLRLKKYELDYRPFRQGPADLVEDDDEF